MRGGWSAAEPVVEAASPGPLPSPQAVLPRPPHAVEAAGRGGYQVRVLARVRELAADAHALERRGEIDAVATLVGVVRARVDDAIGVQAAAQRGRDGNRGAERGRVAELGQEGAGQAQV